MYKLKNDMNVKYFNEPKDVLFINPITRFLAKVFGAKYFVYKCRVCKKIPRVLHGDTCVKHIRI